MITFILLAVCVVDILVFVKLIRVFRLVKVPKVDDTINDLPTVTVCVTARNETHAMTQCLERIVASDYPKLEIIVLDDSSRDDTSLLIKSFAHAGVRFIEGKSLPDGWLGKNYAQLTLAQEASGSVVFFMDVDTLVERHTVMRAVTTMMTRGDKMMSIIPLRSDRWLMSLLFTTMRHFWILMRYKSQRPRATANAWLIERELLLDEFANDATLPLSMKVETAIAGKLTEKGGYHLAMGTPWLGISYEKRWSSQVETSIRILYLQCHKRWIEAAGLVILLTVTVVPYVAVFYTPWAFALIVLQYGVAVYYLGHVWKKYRLIGALFLPVTIVQEIILVILSVYRYSAGTVTWKGRPIANVK